MKKVLLFAFTVFSMSGIAQHIGTMKPVEGFKPKAEPKFEMAKRIDFSQLKPSMQTKAVTEPEGTKTSYFLDYYDYAYQIGPCMRSHVSSDIIIAEDSTVYISNMFLTSMFENVYIKGKLNETGDSIMIENNQVIGTISGYDFYICNADGSSEEFTPLESSFTLGFDPETGIVSSDIKSFLGLYLTDGATSEMYTYCMFLSYIPVDLFIEPVTYDYTCFDYNYGNNYEGADYESTVDVIMMGTLVYIKGLLPYNYPDSWMIGEVSGNDIILYSYQIADDDVAFMFDNGSDYIDEFTLTYNSADNSYTSTTGLSLSSVFYMDENSYTGTSAGYYIDEMCSDMVIEPTKTAINTVEASDKVVASTEYYDLSGRRIFLDDTTKGMCIKVVRYTDGTSNAIKMMR